MDLTHARARTGLGFGLLDLAQGPLLFGQGGVHLGVLVVLVKAGGGQLVGHGGEDGVAEVLGAQLAHERQPRRREQHLLPHLGRVRHVRHRHQVRRAVVPPQQDVQRLVGLEVRAQLRDVGGEVARGRAPRQRGHGRQRLRADGHEQPEERGVGEERVELGDELLGCWDTTVSCVSWVLWT